MIAENTASDSNDEKQFSAVHAAFFHPFQRTMPRFDSGFSRKPVDDFDSSDSAPMRCDCAYALEYFNGNEEGTSTARGEGSRQFMTQLHIERSEL